MNNTFLYFTYGTLMRGERNEHLLEGARYIGKAATKPKYKLFRINGNFPFPAIIDEGGTAVCGELYEVPISALPGMDRMEGHPNFYRRQPIEIDTVVYDNYDGTLDSEVVAYFFVDKKSFKDNYPEIKSGDWHKR